MSEVARSAPIPTLCKRCYITDSGGAPPHFPAPLGGTLRPRVSRFSEFPFADSWLTLSLTFTIEQTKWVGGVLHFGEPELRDCRGSFTLLTMMPPFAKRWSGD